MLENSMDKGYTPPCESENIKECRNYQPDIETVWDNQFFEEKWFNKDSTEYQIQSDALTEDPAIIVLEMLRRNKIDKKFIAFMRFNDTIAKIWKMILKEKDKIVLNEGWPNEYELQVWKRIYTINTVQNSVNEIKK